MKHDLKADAKLGFDRYKKFQAADSWKSVIPIESFYRLRNIALH